MVRHIKLIAVTTIYFFVMSSLGSQANALVEWSDIEPTQGKYSQIYFDYSGGTFYVLNDWAVNREDGGVDGGLRSDEYNRFNFALGSTSYEIRIYPDGSHDILGGVLNNFQSATGWATSPNEVAKHTIWEFKFDVAPTTLSNFKPGDPPGGAVAVFTPPPLKGITAVQVRYHT